MRILFVIILLFISCDSDPASPTDCAGVVSGIAYSDECGDCVGGTTSCTAEENPSGEEGPCEEDYAKDCSGTCDGNAYFDQCDVCDTLPTNDCIADCEGVYGGSAELGVCGFCNGNGCHQQDCDNYPSVNFDCDGDCVAEGDNLTNGFDCLNICGGTAIKDCNEACNGSSLPQENFDCDGNCTATGNNLDENGYDCNSDCGGSLIEDTCGLCDGDGSTCCPETGYEYLTENTFSIDADGILYYYSTSSIYGFQFELSGTTVTNIESLLPSNNSWMFTYDSSVQSNEAGTGIIGLSLDQSFLPQGCGQISAISLNNNENIEISNSIWVDNNLQVLESMVYVPYENEEEACTEQVCLSFSGNTITYSTDIVIQGFQFDHESCITEVVGGDTFPPTFIVQLSDPGNSEISLVLGVALLGAVLPTGNDIELVTITGENYDSTCLSNFVFSDTNGEPLSVGFE